MSKTQKILVTGGAGYVGSVVVNVLLEQGFSVRVIDNLRWGGDALLNFMSNPQFEFQRGDLLNAADIKKAVAGIDGIIHLAAIVGDPACKKEPELARNLNFNASVNLYNAARDAGVKRFIFTSTCSNYGKMKDANSMVTEDSELRPVSLYAELKVEVEKYIMSQQDSMTAVSLRFATAHGLSARMRFDLTVNEFTRDAAIKKELVIFGEKFWRPYCHTRDLARACVLMLNQESSKINRQAFNVGDDNENYQKQMIVDEIKKQLPDLAISFVAQVDDPRDYRVKFDKIKALGFTISKTVPDTIREIRQVLGDKVIESPYDKRYSNI